MDKTQLILTNPASVWLWAKIGESLIKVFAEKLGTKISEKTFEKWKEVKWNKLEREYKKRVEDIYSWTRVLGKPDRIPLDGIFTDVYLIDRPRALQYYDISKLTTEIHISHENENRINGLELVKQEENDKLFILGKPGAGKTTFLKYLTYQAAQGFLSQTPIFVSLKEWSDSKLDLMDFINLQFEVCGFPDKNALPFIKYILKEGYAIVLFDGLDEVNYESDLRHNANIAIRNFCRKYPKSQCLITCRNAALEYQFEDFTYIELADFTLEQIENYINKWFSDQPQKCERLKEELALPENERIRELANTPILLSLVCLTFDNIQSFPSRKVEIYEEALEALLKKWDASREIKRDEIYKDLSPKRKHQMLARIAARTFENGQYFIKQKDLAKYIEDYLVTLPNAVEDELNGEDVLKAVEAQHGIFTERAKKIYSFSHLTFQEYFTSKYIVENQPKKTLEKLLTIENITDPRWREVILNTASLLDDAGEFFKIFGQKIVEIIRDDEQICELLDWTNTKAVNTKTSIKQFKVREFYYFYASEFYVHKHLTNTALTQALGEFQQRILNNSFSKATASLANRIKRNSYKSIFKSNFRLAFTNLDYLIETAAPNDDEFEIWLDLQLWISWLFSDLMIMVKENFKLIDFEVVFKSEIREFHKSLDNIKNELRRRSQDILFPLLEKLQIPTESSSKEQWASFRAEMLRMIRGNRFVKTSSNFNQTQRELLKKYNIATELLAKSLELAVVDHRKDVEGILYASPQ